jgi:hypothetical protein
MIRLPAELPPEAVVVTIDTREQLPVDVSPLTAERGTLATGDYGLRDMPGWALVVESSWQEIERGDWRSKVTASAALGSLLGWIAMGLPVVMACDHKRAGVYIGRILYTAARRRWREARALVGAIQEVATGKESAAA